MQGNIPIPVVEELAVLVERAERACKTTAQLVRDFNFIVVWYQSRPRSRADPHPPSLFPQTRVRRPRTLWVQRFSARPWLHSSATPATRFFARVVASQLVRD